MTNFQQTGPPPILRLDGSADVGVRIAAETSNTALVPAASTATTQARLLRVRTGMRPVNQGIRVKPKAR